MFIEGLHLALDMLVVLSVGSYAAINWRDSVRFAKVEQRIEEIERMIWPSRFKR